MRRRILGNEEKMVRRPQRVACPDRSRLTWYTRLIKDTPMQSETPLIVHMQWRCYADLAFKLIKWLNFQKILSPFNIQTNIFGVQIFLNWLQTNLPQNIFLKISRFFLPGKISLVKEKGVLIEYVYIINLTFHHNFSISQN